MQRHLPLLLLSLSLASPALAAGVDIAWDNCRGEPGAVSLKQFACGNNLGSESLWISFESPVSASSMGRVEVAIDFHTAGGGTLPVWWDFEDLASCRRLGLRVDPEGAVETPTCARIFTSANRPNWVVDRIDYMLPTPDAGRMVVAAAVSGPLVANQRYLACILSLSHANTSNCAGCDVPVVVSVTAVRPDGIIISNALNQNFVNWQTNPTAARATTWGALKGLYR